MGPFIGKWLKLLERHIPMVKAGGAGSTGIQLAKRVMADQVIMYAPLPTLLEIVVDDQGTYWFNDVRGKYGFDGR